LFAETFHELQQSDSDTNASDHDWDEAEGSEPHDADEDDAECLTALSVC
jgi:hypothetical protein